MNASRSSLIRHSSTEAMAVETLPEAIWPQLYLPANRKLTIG